MAVQICESCKHRNRCSCYCSPNSTCEYYEELKLTMEEAMIKAANESGVTSHQLLDVMVQQGITGVYNLGLKHMYEYLEK